MASSTQEKLAQLFQNICRLSPEEAQIAANATTQPQRHDRAGWPSNEPACDRDPFELEFFKD